MKQLNFLTVILCGLIVLIVILFSTIPCYAQLYPILNPYTPTYPLGFNMFYPSYNLIPPYLPPLPAFGAQILNPAMSPLIAVTPSISRSAATTIVILPQQTTPVTAYAPLGTLTLTPSTLVFLILLFTLHE